MTTRALLVAIEHYSKLNESLAAALPGTIVAASRFRQWLLEEKKVDAKLIRFCCDGAVEGRTAGTTYNEIVDAIDGLLAEGRDKTDELYCFFSCHGFAYRDRHSVADVIVCSDYRDRGRSGNVCLRLDEVQDFLQRRMGPGCHYYFVDACRTELGFDEIVVSSLPLVRPDSKLGTPGVYTLYSTQPGTTAIVASDFADALMKGLGGYGRAKAWVKEALAVQYLSLVEFVEGALKPKQDVDHEASGAAANPTILTLPTVPQHRCTIDVIGAKAEHRFEARVLSRGREIKRFSFDGPKGEFLERPDDYGVEVSRGDTGLECSDPLPVDLFEPNTVRFAEVTSRSLTFGRDPAELTVEAPPSLRLRVSNVDRPSQGTDLEPGTRAVFEAGSYRIEVFDQSGSKLAEDAITVRALGKTYRYSLTAVRGLRRALLGRLPHDETALRIGGQPIADTGLDLWLALLGAARILDNQEINSDGLRSFANEPPGASPCYVLWGADQPVAASRAVALSEPASREQVSWRPAEAVAGLEGLAHCYFEPATAGTLVSFASGDGPATTVATARLPNRVSLLVVTDGPKGSRNVLQFLLPMAHRIPFLPGEVRGRLEGLAAMASVVTMVWMIREFAARRALSAVMDDDVTVELAYAKWIDPLMGLLAGFELARRGPGEAERWRALVGASRDQLAATMLRNLGTFFPELPDLPALARRLEAAPPAGNPRGIPILLDGYLALEPGERGPWPPIERLDYRGPWTQWLGVVRR